MCTYTYRHGPILRPNPDLVNPDRWPRVGAPPKARIGPIEAHFGSVGSVVEGEAINHMVLAGPAELELSHESESSWTSSSAARSHAFELAPAPAKDGVADMISHGACTVAVPW